MPIPPTQPCFSTASVNRETFRLRCSRPRCSTIVSRVLFHYARRATFVIRCAVSDLSCQKVSASCKQIGPYSGRCSEDVMASSIKHVVIIVKENHTFDNYFGRFQGANGKNDLANAANPPPNDPDHKHH